MKELRGMDKEASNIEMSTNCIVTARIVSLFGVFLVRIYLHSDWIRTRKTPNTDTFHTVCSF